EALLAALDDGTEPPDVVLVRAGTGSPPATASSVELAEAARASCEATLDLLKRWLSDERLGPSRLAFVTGEAVAVRAGEAPDLAAAPVWGLLRSAQAENPGRISLLDVDGEDSSRQALSAALASDEWQLALRDGALLAPRLLRAAADAEEA